MAPFTRWVTDTYADAKDNRLLIKPPNTIYIGQYRKGWQKDEDREILIMASCHNKLIIGDRRLNDHTLPQLNIGCRIHDQIKLLLYVIWAFQGATA